MSVVHIAWRELRAILVTAIGWMVLCGFLLLTGIFWIAMVSGYVAASQEAVFNPYGAALMNFTDHLLMPFFGNCTVLLVFVIPALSMRSFAEEFRQRTAELLFTSPISTLEIVLGKYLGLLGFVVLMLLCTAHYPASLLAWGSPDPGAVFGGYLALFLMSAALLAVGVLTSSFTHNQIVALILSFAIALALYVGSWLSQDPDSWIAQLALTTHLEGVLRGALRLSDLAYFAGFVVVGLLATHQRIESFRWR